MLTKPCTFFSFNTDQPPIDGKITTEKKTFLRRDITVLVPEGSLSQESDDVELLILRDTVPFQYPAGYQAAGPVYLVKPSRNIHLQKSITVRMRHFAQLRNDEDIRKVTFVSATPGLLWKRFKKIAGSFKVGSSFGEVKLDVLSHFKLTIAVKKDAAHVLLVEQVPLPKLARWSNTFKQSM